MSLKQILLDKEKHEASWSSSYPVIASVINNHTNKGIGVELGVAFGGNAKYLLNNTNIKKLYCVDTYKHRNNYDDPMNYVQSDFNKLYIYAKRRLGKNKRIHFLREDSVKSAELIKHNIDFVYIDADHSYSGVLRDLSAWFGKVKDGGLVMGHDYQHVNFPGVKKAVDDFFNRFGWKVHSHESGVWWVIKNRISITYIIPAFNSSSTLMESICSIYDHNFIKGDEVIIVDDASNDNTKEILLNAKKNYESLRIYTHTFNMGGGAARNTAILNSKNPLIFCLDSDNLLLPNSINKLKLSLIGTCSDSACFAKVSYFNSTKRKITHIWEYNSAINIQLYLESYKVPGASGNYLFTKRSWVGSGMYPQNCGALDTWCFGFKQLYAGYNMNVVNNSTYLHRYGNDSYWARFRKESNTSIVLGSFLLNYYKIIDNKDFKYMYSIKNRENWFENLEARPIKLVKEKINSLSKLNIYKYIKIWLTKLN